MGKILRVDLTRQKFSEEDLKEEYAEMFIGGRGLAAKILFDELRAGVDPLGPDNKIIIARGPLTGTAMPFSSRLVISTKSPLTGIYLYTVAGGMFGAALTRSGFDVVVIEGVASKPQCLFIDDGRATLLDAGFIWGATTSDSCRHIKRSLGSDVSVITIGPAGERLAKMASVITDDMRAFGRGGVGAVFGSKKLKAIAARGRHEIIYADKQAFLTNLRRIQEAVLKSPAERRRTLTGTQESPSISSEVGILPTRNWRESVFEGASEISYPRLRERFVVKDLGCPGCMVRCTKLTLVREGPYTGAMSEGPEYETLYALGSCCGIDRPDAIIMADRLCDEYGLDTISTGVTVAWAMECFEKGMLSPEDTDGLQLRFGNHDAMIQAIRKIAFREGKLGSLLADGVREASRRVGKGSERFAMHVKGLELGGYDPRGSRGQGIVYACGPRGGCHHAIGVVARMELDAPTKIEGKGELVHRAGRTRILFDSAPSCTFQSATVMTLELLLNAVTSATGMALTMNDFLEVADRVYAVERAFNVREGITRDADILPERILSEPLPSGPKKGQVVSREELEAMKSDFYRSLGWDEKTGIPTRGRLEALKLGDVANQLLETLGFLPE
jgi:aldehyde:ferredoxin oxidoreductase